MGRLCPYCESIELVAPGDVPLLQCPACGRSALPESYDEWSLASPATHAASAVATGVSATRAQRTAPPAARSRRGAPGEIPSLPAAGLALVVTVLLYGLLGLLPATRISELFLARGWVPYGITAISAWALCLLGMKLLRLRQERRLLQRDWLACHTEPTIHPADAGAIVARIESLPDAISGSFVARRLERVLRHFESRRRVVEVVDFLTAEAQADEGRVDASYGLVRVFVWAVPTLGFIGTVIGIGAAVAGFSETLDAASSLEGMKESIGSVTGGLGIAFDTTLLALVMSILIMFPSSALQRLEESFLTEVDDYCAEELVRRFADEPPAGGEAEREAHTIDALAKRLVEAMRTPPARTD